MFGKRSKDSIDTTDQEELADNMDLPAEQPVANADFPKEPAPQPQPLPALENQPSQSELERLRDILFGSQARSTDKQITDLSSQIEALRRDLTDQLNEKFDTLANNAHDETQGVNKELSDRLTTINNTQINDLRSTKTELNQRIDTLGSDQENQLRITQRELIEKMDEQAASQSQQLRIAQQELAERIEKLATDFFTQLRDTQKSINDRIDNLESTQTERLRQLQLQTRQRDDNQREELLQLAASLDNRKTSRHDLGQMLMELGQRLGSDDTK